MTTNQLTNSTREQNLLPTTRTVLATLLPILAILLIISVCLIIYCCRRWRKQSASKGFRNIGNFGPNIIGSTLDRKAMLESSSESSDTHQRNHHNLHRAAAAAGAPMNALYDAHGPVPVSTPSEHSYLELDLSSTGRF